VDSISSSATPYGAPNRGTVLVADDSRSVRLALGGVFEAAGFENCVEAKDGAEAIAQADQCHPDLIVLDLSMPVMNGLNAAQILKDRLPATPIILFTMYADEIRDQGEAAGIRSVVPKPDVNMLIREAKARTPTK
jgi:CheY-like chemotaxis protein